ncbi:serine/threonine-protein kinase [Streptosporangium sp. V21-05]|uniref:serine/threonine-protein kinase n=1 Tax=Streptosporangium sp. V21-05 TaxID=3446115 RepID=UPI003F534B2E
MSVSESVAGVVGVWEGKAAVLAGRYRLDELIGRGGTGEVWRGYDLRPGWAVAVKILSPAVADATTRERFAREARTAARVVHPNVVTVLDVGEHEDRPYLVMELLTGRDLAAELAGRGPLSVSETCHLAGQAALGLDAAHRAGVVHRDVKPANLHLGANGALKVVDFGTARVATEAATRLTSAGSVIGTAAYLSPEQILGEPGDAASDLYALGCVCYELLCGRPPFAGPATEMIYRHVHDRPDPLRRYRPDVPVELERLVLALLEKDPGARPAGGEVVRLLAGTAGHASATRDIAPPTPTATPTPASAYGTVSPRATPGPTPTYDTVSPTVAPGAGPTPVPGAGVLSALTRGRSPGRSVAIALGVVAVLAVLVATALWALVPSDPVGRAGTAAPTAIGAATPSGTRSPARPVSSSPTPSPTPAVSRSASPAPVRSSAARGWPELLPAFHRAVTDQERQGKIDRRVAREIRERIVKTARALQRGENEKARDELRKLGRDLSEARRRGRLASDGPLIAFLRDSGFVFQADSRDRGPGRHHSKGDDENEDEDDDSGDED